MESPTRYDLTAALAGWRAELAAQTQLTTEARRELESHLLDAIAGYRQRGLTDDEAFWLGRRQLGQPEQLAAEFTKAHPAAIWRERLFWIALALLANRLWGMTIFALTRVLSGDNFNHVFRVRDLLPDWVVFYLPQWLQNFQGISIYWLSNYVIWVPAVVLAIALAKGWLKSSPASLGHFIFQSRTRLALACLTILLTVYCLYFSIAFRNMPGSPEGSALSFLTNLITTLSIWDLSLIALIAWLMPAPRPRQLKTA